MPWLTLDFSDPDREAYGEKYEVSGIPALIIIDANGNVLSDEAVGDIRNK